MVHRVYNLSPAKRAVAAHRAGLPNETAKCRFGLLEVVEPACEGGALGHPVRVRAVVRAPGETEFFQRTPSSLEVGGQEAGEGRPS
jgi:hypothetical protein